MIDKGASAPMAAAASMIDSGASAPEAAAVPLVTACAGCSFLAAVATLSNASASASLLASSIFCFFRQGVQSFKIRDNARAVKT